MATISKDIKDEFVVAVARALGFSYDPTKPPPFEDHLAAIQAKLDELIDPLYGKIVLEDPDVVAKRQELHDLIAQKKAEAQPVKPPDEADAKAADATLAASIT